MTREGQPEVKLQITGSPRVQLLNVRTGGPMSWWAGPTRGAEIVVYIAAHGGAALVDICMAVWWKVDAATARKRFHAALGAWHASLRRASGHGKDLAIVVRSGRDFYRIADGVVVDVAEFQRLYQKAMATDDAATAIELHIAAAASIRGPLLAGGCDYLWSAPARADLNRDVVLNLSRLSRLLSESRRPWDAVAALVRILEVDGACQTLGCHLMELYEELGHPELAVATYHRMREYLAQLGRKPSTATTRLYRAICRRHGLT